MKAFKVQLEKESLIIQAESPEQAALKGLPKLLSSTDMMGGRFVPFAWPEGADGTVVESFDVTVTEEVEDPDWDFTYFDEEPYVVEVSYTQPTLKVVKSGSDQKKQERENL